METEHTAALKRAYQEAAARVARFAAPSLCIAGRNALQTVAQIDERANALGIDPREPVGIIRKTKPAVPGMDIVMPDGLEFWTALPRSTTDAEIEAEADEIRAFLAHVDADMIRDPEECDGPDEDGDGWENRALARIGA